MPNVPGQVGQHNAPGERIFPGSRAYRDVLAMLGDPDTQYFKAGLVTRGRRRKIERLVGRHQECSVGLTSPFPTVLASFPRQCRGDAQRIIDSWLRSRNLTSG